jgi:hypothetical protein
MPNGLTDPLTMLAFSSMPIAQLCEHHRRIVAALRDADHWHRLVSARIDLAVATVTDLDDLAPPQGAGAYAFSVPAPQGMRALIGMARNDLRLQESTVLTQLRSALIQLDHYIESLSAVAAEASAMITERVGSATIAV